MFANHLNEFNTITSKLSSVRVKFDDEVRDLLIMLSLLKRWNGLVMTISNYVPSSNTLKFDDVVGFIISEKMRRKRTCETQATLLTMERRERQRERGRRLGNHKHYRKGRSKSIFGMAEFWNYGKKVHLKKYYKAPKKKGDEKHETT